MPPQVLVVDDQPLNIEVIRAMLANKGFSIDYAVSEKHALKKIKKRMKLHMTEKVSMYQLIMLDYSMPEVDGPVFAQTIRSIYKEDPKLRELEAPLICCCTAY